MQVFAFLALVSGAFTVRARLTSAAAAPAPEASAPASAEAAKTFASEDPPAVGPARFAPAAPVPTQAPAPAAPAGSVSMSLKAKTPGRWVVDGAGGADADSTKLTDVVASAADGDVVLIKPGFYGETVVLSRAITLRGAGSDRGAVTISAVGPLTLAVGTGRARIENLTVGNNGGSAATAVAVSKGELTLSNVAIRAPQGQGLRVTKGSIYAEKCEVESRIAVIAEADSTLRLEDCSVSGTEAGVLVKAQAGPVEARVSKTRFHDSERAINLEGDVRASVDSCDFKLSGPGGGLFAFENAQATVRDSKFDLGNASQVGLYAQKGKITASKVSIRSSAGAGVIANNSTVVLEDTTVEFNRDCAVKLDGSTLELRKATLRRNRCGVGFQSPGELRSYDSAFSENAMGPLAAKPGIEDRIKLGGAGNTGVDLTAFNPNRPAAPEPQAAAQRNNQPNEPVQFKNDVFSQYKRRRF